MIMMTILNVYLSDNEKLKLKRVVEENEIKSMSEFVRKVINEQVMVASEKNFDSLKDFPIPDYIPKNKYVLFTSNKSIGAVGDTPSEVAQIAADNGIAPPFSIKYNGKDLPKVKEYIYSLNVGKAWHYAEFLQHSYPIIELSFISGNIHKNLFASIDTAASICVLKEGILNTKEFNKIHSDVDISTAGGIIKKELYSANVHIVDQNFEIQFVTAPIDDSLPFNFLIGRNLLDQLDAFFFGLKQILLLKLSEK